ncbi:MAG: TlpA family protein disulfide reductase [Christensenellales bacterium]
MNSKTKILIICAAIVSLLVLSYFAYGWLSKNYKPQVGIAGTAKGNAASQTTPGPTEEERTKASDFSVQNSDGKKVKLSDYFGKPVVLNFWASWCSPCKSEMPEFQDVYEDAGDEVVFMMVNLTDGSRETLESATEFIEAQGYTFPVYYDVDQEAAYVYGVSSIPMTVFIDQDGYMVAYANGAIDRETLQKGISMINPGD